MRAVTRESPAEVGRAAASILLALLRDLPEAAVALPSGRTPLPAYTTLVEAHARGQADLSRATWFALDEFLSPSLPPAASFRHFLLEHFIRPAGLDERLLFSPEPACGDPRAEGRRYEEIIRQKGGLALALLGIGANGHIAFNEPGTPFDSTTGPRSLTPATIAANRYLFPPGTVPPSTAISMGIGTICRARKVVLMATGAGKAAIVAKLLGSPPSPELPASALRNHPDCTLLLDREAAPSNCASAPTPR
jgi:glucosamine-6-phosphate deaminase